MPGWKRDVEHAIPISLLFECFDCDAEKGTLTWRVRPIHHFKNTRAAKIINTQHAGSAAGSDHSAGYRSVCVNGKHLLVHRVIFAMHHGRWPDDELDHKDRQRNNNRISNLREAGPQKNQGNQKLRRNNTSGFRGAYWAAHAGRWKAMVSHEGEVHNLGYFDTAEGAGEAAARKRDQLFGEFHG